jgi:hypothetical protein
MDDCISQCQRGQFMRALLGLRGELVPLGAVQDGDVAVNCFAEEWACTDCSKTPIKTSVLAMALVHYTCPHQLEFIDGHVVDVLNDGVHEEAEVSKTCFATFNVVCCCNTVEVINRRHMDFRISSAISRNTGGPDLHILRMFS